MSSYKVVYSRGVFDIEDIVIASSKEEAVKIANAQAQSLCEEGLDTYVISVEEDDD